MSRSGIASWDPAAHAAELLGRIGPEARQAVPALMEAMKAPDSVLCACAIEALGEIGPDAKQAIPAIVERLGDHREAQAYQRSPLDIRWHLGSGQYSLDRVGQDGAGCGCRSDSRPETSRQGGPPAGSPRPEGTGPARDCPP